MNDQATTQQEGEAAGGPLKPTVADVLGQITWLMTQSAKHKQFFLSDLEWLVMPAILAGQFKIFKKEQTPVGVVLWARASDEVAARVEQGNNRLQLKEWRSGEKVVVIDVIAPFGAEEEMKQQALQDALAANH